MTDPSCLIAIFDNLRYCNQAEASEAAAAQIAAQTPSDDNRTTSHKAFFVRPKQRARCDAKLLSTSASLVVSSVL
jgi:hypothetical protein